VVKSYASDGALVAPIVFTEASVTLRHILALFTPPEKMPGASSILGTIQLIISQLEEPFDLQRKRFITNAKRISSHPLQDSSNWWTKRLGVLMEPTLWL